MVLQHFYIKPRNVFIDLCCSPALHEGFLEPGFWLQDAEWLVLELMELLPLSPHPVQMSEVSLLSSQVLEALQWLLPHRVMNS